MNKNKSFEISDLMRGARHDRMICDIHGDYKAIVLANGHISPCPSCFEIELEKEAVMAITMQSEQNKQVSLRSRIIQTGIPERFLSRGLNNYQCSKTAKGQQDVFDNMYEYINQFPCEGGRSIGIVGKTGTGKTHLACAAGMEIMRKGYTVRFSAVLTLLRAVKSTYGIGSKMTEAEAMDSFCAPELLIVDDIGVKMESETDRSIIYEIVNQRNLDRKSMIYTSNMSFEMLRESVGDRVISRLCENNGKVLHCQWSDYRLKGQP